MAAVWSLWPMSRNPFTSLKRFQTLCRKERSSRTVICSLGVTLPKEILRVPIFCRHPCFPLRVEWSHGDACALDKPLPVFDYLLRIRVLCTNDLRRLHQIARVPRDRVYSGS